MLIGLVGLAATEPMRIGLIGPVREDPAWVALQMGMRQALSVHGQTNEVRFVDATPSRATSTSLVPALERLRGEGVDALVIMTTQSIATEELPQVREVPTCWVENTPINGGPWTSWAVDWMGWARALQIVAAAVANTPDGSLIAYLGLREVLPAEGWKVLSNAENWPLTGIWEGREVLDLSALDRRERLGIVVWGNRDALIQNGILPLPMVRSLAVWMDALTLQHIETSDLEVIVVPHYVEAGGEIIDHLLSHQEGNASSANVFERSIGPLIVTSENLPAWRAFWQRWQF